MLKPRFQLTKTIDLQFYRFAQGGFVRGVYTKGVATPVTVKANIQPLKESEILLLPESERTKKWVKLYSSEEMRIQKEGSGGHDADEFDYQGERYRVMKVENYVMGTLDHWKAVAARIELSPN